MKLKVSIVALALLASCSPCVPDGMPPIGAEVAVFTEQKAYRAKGIVGGYVGQFLVVDEHRIRTKEIQAWTLIQEAK